MAKAPVVPHDEAVEREALGKCLVAPDLLLESGLDDGHFYVERHRRIWGAMLSLHADGLPVDTNHVAERLKERGHLERAGGLEYLLGLCDVVPVNLPTAILRKYRDARVALAAAHRAADAAARGEVAEAREALTSGAELLSRPERANLLDEAWRTVGEWGALTSEPPPRRWLLERPDDQTDGYAGNVGVLPSGKTGLLVSAGGVGKTMALIQLAIAVATGRRWLEYFETPAPGRVLLALAEEDREEFWRRFYNTARAMRLTEEQEKLAAERIVALPLAGHGVALVACDGGNTVETELLHDLLRRLGQHEWSLIVLDPLSRFAGADTEKDNAAATRFVQVLESFSKAPGNPTVLASHHTNKTSRGDDSSASAAHARGASGLIDGARWVANLENVGPDAARLTVTKSNYAPHGSPVDLVRDADHGGYLRVATSEERRRSAEKREAREFEESEAKAERVQAAVIAALEAAGTLPTKEAVQKAARKNRTDTWRAIATLEANGVIHKTSRGYELVREVQS